MTALHTIKQVGLRIREEVRQRLQESAEANGVSLNMEISKRLERSLEADDADRFWEAARDVVDAQNRLIRPLLEQSRHKIEVKRLRQENEALREALREIHGEADAYQQIYHRNGPSWTGKDGHEYEDASYVLEKTEVIANLATAAIEKAEGRS